MSWAVNEGIRDVAKEGGNRGKIAESRPTHLLLEVLLGADPPEHAEHQPRVGTNLVVNINVDDVVAVQV